MYDCSDGGGISSYMHDQTVTRTRTRKTVLRCAK